MVSKIPLEEMSDSEFNDLEAKLLGDKMSRKEKLELVRQVYGVECDGPAIVQLCDEAHMHTRERGCVGYSTRHASVVDYLVHEVLEYEFLRFL